MSTTLRLVSEMERIASALGAERGQASQVSLSSVAEKIAKNLGVRNEEVAILAVSKRWRHLHFLVPEALKKVGLFHFRAILPSRRAPPAIAVPRSRIILPPRST